MGLHVPGVHMKMVAVAFNDSRPILSRLDDVRQLLIRHVCYHIRKTSS